MSNFLLSSPELGGGFPVVPTQRDDGTEEYVFRYPRWGDADSTVPLIDIAEDFGSIVAGIWITGRSGIVQGVSEPLSYQQIVDEFVQCEYLLEPIRKDDAEADMQFSDRKESTCRRDPTGRV